MDLRPHLRCQILLGRQPRKSTRLRDCVRQRLLTIDVLTKIERQRRGGCMRMICGGNNNRIALVDLRFKHLAVIPVDPRRRPAFRGRS